MKLQKTRNLNLLNSNDILLTVLYLKYLKNRIEEPVLLYLTANQRLKSPV